MKVGDKIKVIRGTESEAGKIIRFYANQGTVLVEMETGNLVYFSYESLDKKCF